LILTLLAAEPPGAFEVALTLRDGVLVEGRSALGPAVLTTSYGSATVDADRIAMVEFGAEDRVTAADGTVLRGVLRWPAVALDDAGGGRSVPRDALRSLVVVHRPAFTPGVVTDGVFRNGLTYHVRAPGAFDASRTWPCVVILHGSNMNARAYVETIAQAWPSLAEECLLVGIDGEQRSPASTADSPAFNYTYVNYVGKSRYRGYPGTDRESPALVAEVLADLRGTMPVNAVYVGGHSQGAFLTYAILMNFPGLIDGAFPVSGGLIFQCEPSAYEDDALRAQQRKVPLAIVHGTSDPVVSFGMGRYARECFEDAGFPALRLFTDDAAGHRFAMLPVESAVRWLRAMSSRDPDALARFARERLEAGEYRDASAALARLRASAPEHGAVTPLDNALGAAATPGRDRLLGAIRANTDAGWVPEFLEYRAKFEGVPAATPVFEAYAQLRAIHQLQAEKVFEKAQEAFRNGDQDQGYAQYRKIAERYYASAFSRLVRQALDEREPPGGAR
jgi:predicted esterase